jgi:exodeoxyribonuclease VII small subunit
LTTIPANDIEAFTFEQAMKELEAIVRRLESGTADLESAIRDYERGKQLQRHCEKKLNDARMKVEAVVKNETGTLSLKPFENA